MGILGRRMRLLWVALHILSVVRRTNMGSRRILPVTMGVIGAAQSMAVRNLERLGGRALVRIRGRAAPAISRLWAQWPLHHHSPPPPLGTIHVLHLAVKGWWDMPIIGLFLRWNSTFHQDLVRLESSLQVQTLSPGHLAKVAFRSDPSAHPLE
jgi:hypothetical protein